MAVGPGGARGADGGESGDSGALGEIRAERLPEARFRTAAYVNKGAGGMWGEFYVPDSSYNSHWTPVRKAETCSAASPGFAKFVAKLELEEVEAGKPAAWARYVLCRGKEATIEGVHFARPDRCVVKGAQGTFGEFYIHDFGCDGAVIKEVVVR